MTKYRELIDLIEENNFTIKIGDCYDAQSGWTGRSYFIYDGDKCLTDMSVNGFCFNDDRINETIKILNRYLKEKNLDTFEDFVRYVEEFGEHLPGNSNSAYCILDNDKRYWV